MSAPAIALPPGPSGSPAKPKKRKSSSGPSVSDRILKVVAASSERGGLSLAALKKNLKAGGYDVVKNNARIRAAIKRLKAKKVLVQTKGSFKLNKKPPKKKVVKKRKPKPKKAKKAGAKKAKKAGAKKAKKAGAKKAGAKKKKKSTSPKKAVKKAGAAKKKRASPKKTVKKGPKKAKRATKSKAAAKK